MKDFNLSQHFKYSEMVSTSHGEFRKENENNGIGFVPAMRRLCDNALEKIRSIVGPMTISSGYRCPALNKAVGGSQSSLHLKGRAADIVRPWNDFAGMVTETRAAVADLSARGLLKGFDVVCERSARGGIWVHIEEDDLDYVSPVRFFVKEEGKATRQLKV